jgi:inner membrane protein
VSGGGANATAAGPRATGARPAELRSRVLCPPAWAIVLAFALFVVDQWAYQRAGVAIARQAPLDWIDHVLTTLFIAWAAGRLFERDWLVPAVIASVVIDADHIPQRLGSYILTAGTARPVTHSLATIVVLMLLSLPRSRWRPLMVGAAIGVASHLWRDLAEPRGAGVPLLWPLSDETITTPALLYLASIGALAVIALAQAWRGARAPKGPTDPKARTT